MLCVAILRALGIEANPVLVSTDLRQTIQDWQPTPTVFDHAIVQVSVVQPELLAGPDGWL